MLTEQKYVCLCCGTVFDEPYHEPAGMFMYNPMVHDVCPECGDDAFEEITEEEDDDL